MAIPIETLRAQAKNAGARPRPAISPGRRTRYVSWTLLATVVLAALCIQHDLHRPASPAPLPVPATPGLLSTDRLAAAIEPQVLRLLQSSHQAIADDAISAGLSVGPSSHSSVARDAARAGLHRDAAYCAFRNGEFGAAVTLQSQAVDADRLDARLTGDLAIYLLRLRRHDEAYRTVLAALALRCSGSSASDGTPADRASCAAPSGRTADWETLAAILMAQGRHDYAIAAVRIAHATVTDTVRRKRSAYCANRYTFAGLLSEAHQVVYPDLAATYSGREHNVCKPIRVLTLKRCDNVTSQLVPAP